MKPVIISDGFDPGDKRKIQASDYVNYIPGKDVSIEDMMRYVNCKGDSAELIDTLNARGYDVVIVNYPTYTSAETGKEIDGGADFIERNAMAMIALIQKLNATLAKNGSTEQLVVVGPSMGGQITRYALAYMEKQYAATKKAKWLHKTRLWVSIDSPHLGANIPEGLQALVNLLKDESTDAADYYYNQLGAPAAKQQLINWHQEGSSYNSVNTDDLNGRTKSQGWPSNSGSSFYQHFYNNEYSNGLANSNGYPVNLRKIALINGSVTGKTYGTDGQQTLDIIGYTQICTIWCWDIQVAAFESYTLPAFGTDRNIARYKNTFTDHHTHAPNNDTRGNVDILPGGWYPGYEQLGESIMGTDEDGVSFEQKTNQQVHCFIPSFSALGMKNPDQDWAQSLKRNLICSNEIPFDSYFGHDDNTQHTSFDCESVNWLLKELDGKPQEPWFPLTDNDLSGPSTLCIDDTKAYGFASLCAVPGAVSWKVSSNIKKVSSTPYSINLKGTTAGKGTITAIFSNGEKVVKTINVGSPNASISATQTNTCSNGYQTWSLTTNSSYGSNWHWTVDYAGSNSDITIQNPYSYETDVNVKGGGIVKLTYTNLCSDTSTYSVTVYSNCPQTFTVIPNPAQDNITVSSSNLSAGQKSVSSLMYAIKITDQLGSVRKTFQFKAGITATKIVVTDLNAGMYVVSVFDGYKWTSKSLIINK